MPKCLECGKITTRLQWTHFKYKCTGRFNDSKEYKVVYPNAKLVDNDVAKRACVTEKGLIEKYGEEEGLNRWNSYRNKQANTNSFEYKKERYGWTRDKFDEYNKSRAVTIENMIKRHGDNKGTKKWLEYCDRQAYTNTLDYFIEREGSIKNGLEIYEKVNREKSNPMNPQWIAEKYDISFDEAVLLISNRRTHNFVSEGEKYFVDLLEKELNENIKYTYKTKQFCVWSHKLNSSLFYDIVCSKRKKVIEYNGDYWHANPILYESDFVIKQSDMSAKEIWERDQIKIKEIIDRGFEVKIVWESEFLKNEKMIKEVVKWFKN